MREIDQKLQELVPKINESNIICRELKRDNIMYKPDIFTEVTPDGSRISRVQVKVYQDRNNEDTASVIPYDIFMEEEGIPVFRGIGMKRVHDLPLAPWTRLGGRGSYIQLFGTEGLWGMYVVEVPGAGALNAERHLFEKIVLAVEGRGSTEVWQEGQTKKQTFEWQKGSLFSIPLNAFHRFVNATNSPAIILCGTSAPNVFNLFDNPHFIFNSLNSLRALIEEDPARARGAVTRLAALLKDAVPPGSAATKK